MAERIILYSHFEMAERINFSENDAHKVSGTVLEYMFT